METRQVLLVDAFAADPMGGTPVGIVLDAGDLAADQRTAVADELGGPSTAFVSRVDDGWTVDTAGPRDDGRALHVLVAVASTLDDRGALDSDRAAFQLDDRDVSARVAADGRVWIEVDEPDLREADVTEDEVAGALGIDVASIRDVGADMPIVRASLGRGTLLVPVNFLEHLSGADPDPGALADLLDATTAETVQAFTFDTLGADNDVHGLAIDRDGTAVPATGEAAACAAAALRRHGAFDHDRTELRFEAGDLQDRPARVVVDTAEGVAVGGRAVSVLNGTVVVPPATDDEIVEA